MVGRGAWVQRTRWLDGTLQMGEWYVQITWFYSIPDPSSDNTNVKLVKLYEPATGFGTSARQVSNSSCTLDNDNNKQDGKPQANGFWCCAHCAPSHCRTNYNEIKHTLESQHQPGPVPPALCMSTTQMQTQMQTQSQAHQTRTVVIPLATTHRQHRRALPPAQDGSASSLATDSITTPISEDTANGAAAHAVRSRTGILDDLTSHLWWVGRHQQTPNKYRPSQSGSHRSACASC